MALEVDGFPLSPVGLQAWGAARRVSKDDWLEWLRRLSLELLKDSSSPSLRSCWALAQAYNPMARYGMPGSCFPASDWGQGDQRIEDYIQKLAIAVGLVSLVLLTSGGGM